MFVPRGGLSKLKKSIIESVERLHENGARRADVETHEAFSTRAEHLAVVQGEMRLVDEEIVQLRMVHAEAAAIKPDQEGCLWPQGFNARKVFFAEANDKIDVVLQIGDHLPPPLFAVLEGGKSDNRGEHRRLAEFIHLQPIEELMAYLLIRDNGVSADDARDVERLRGSRQCDAVAGGGFRDGCERDVPVVPQRHVAVDFVGNDKDVMLHAEVRQPGECFAIPHDAARIVGIAEDHHPALVIDDRRKMFKIHVIDSVIAELKRIYDDLSSVAFRRDTEVVVDGSLDDDFLIRLREDIDGEADAFDDAWNEGQPVFGDIPSMVVLRPFRDGRPQFRRCYRIS